MAVGITSFAYRWAVRFGRIDIFKLLECAYSAGAEIVQICDNVSLEDFSKDMLRDLAQCARGHGITLEFGIKGCDIDQLRRALDISNLLGSNLLRLTVSMPEKVSTVDHLVENIGAVLPDFRSSGITLAIENHSKLVPQEIIQVIKLLDDPIVGACLDPVNSISRLVGSSEAVSALAPYAVSVHVKDVLPVPFNTGFYIAGCPLGEGLVNVPGILAAVRSADRCPNFLIEAWMDRLEDEDATLTKEKAWVRQGIVYLKRVVI